MKYITSFFLLLVSAHLSAQNASVNSLDLKSQGAQYFKLQKYDSSMMFYSRAAEIFHKNEQMEDYFFCSNKVAECLNLLIDYDSSLTVSKRILAELEPSQDSLLAQVYYILGDSYFYKQEMDSCYVSIKKSLFHTSKAYGKDDLRTLLSHQNVANYFWFVGNVDSVKYHFESGLSIARTRTFVFHEDLKEFYNSIMRFYFQLGMTDFANQLNDELLSLIIDNYGEGSNEVADHYVYYADDPNIDISTVIHCYKMALKIFSVNMNRSKMSMCFAGIGQGYLRLEKYEDALENFDIALKTMDHGKLAFDDFIAFYMSHYQMSHIYYIQGDSKRGLESMLKATNFGEKYALDARSRLNMRLGLAGAYLVSNKPDSAIAYLNNFIEDSRKTYYPPGELSSFYITMSQASYQTQDYLQAIIYSDLADSLSLVGRGKYFFNLSKTKSLLALGRVKDASNQQINLKTESGIDSKNPLGAFESIVLRTAILNILGEPIVQDHYREINAFYISYIKQTFNRLSETERENFYNKFSNYFASFQNYALLHPEMIPDLINLRIETKSILLNMSNVIKRRILASGDKALIDLYDEVQVLKQEIEQLSETQSEPVSSKADSLRAIINSKDQQLSKYASYYSNDQTQHKWEDIQARLNKNEAAVEIIRVQGYDFYKLKETDSVFYAALIITPKTKKQPDLVLLGNGNELENKILNGYRNSIYYKTKNSSAYDHYWRPIKDALKKVETVYFSPDGAYNLLNLSTLYNEEEDRFLFDETNIVTLTSMKDLLAEKRPEMPYNSSILIGNPDFKGAPQNDQRALNLRDMKEAGISALPGTAVEIEEISNMFEQQGWKQEVWTLGTATEGQLKTMLKPKVLHIATHGFFEENVSTVTDISNPLFRCGLLFTGAEETIRGDKSFRANVRSDTEDGILTAFEAMNLNVDNTELVVLSACETGLGEIRNGEGVYGLRRAFKVAGAKNILTSLWRVDDEVTTKLMTSFYENWLSGETKQYALRNAQEVIKASYPDPYYWGAFLLVGE